MMRIRTLTAAALAAAAVAPAAAAAHVTLQPPQGPAGGFTRLDVRVPNERDDEGTTRVDVQLPPGFAFLSYEPQPGWKVKVTREKLDTPIEIEEGFEVDEQITRVTFTGDGKAGLIRPGQFKDFGLSVRLPAGKPGDKLTFKALQTYESGDVVRWIGKPDSDEPAPQVTLTEARGHGAPAAHEAKPQVQAAPATGAGGGDDGGSDALAITGIAMGALALLAALVALARGRRQTPVTA